MAAVAGPADKKVSPAFLPSTDPMANLDWQSARAFPKAGLDNGRQSWQAMNRLQAVP